MKFAVLALVAFFGLAAQASSHYDDTLAMFNSGKALNPQALEAAYSGRCFVNTNPDDATGALLVGSRFTTPNDDAGPAFPSKTVLYANLFNGMGNDSHYRFDNYTYAQSLQMLTSNMTCSSPVAAQGADLAWSTNYVNGSAGSFYARQYKNYVVVYSVNATTNETYACYFYNRLP